MSTLLETLTDPSQSGVYRAPDDRAMPKVRAEAALHVTRIELAAGKDAVLAQIARQLEFPPWFGGNWDALEDCLTDLAWRPGTARVILFSGATPRGDLGVLIDVLASAADFWRQRGRAFFAVFADPERHLDLPTLPEENAA